MTTPTTDLLFEELIATRMETTAMLHEQLACQMPRAAEFMISSLSEGGKLFFSASPALHAITSQVVDNLMLRKLSDQPALPALLLPLASTATADKSVHHENIQDKHYENLFMQLEAVVTKQDCVIILDDATTSSWHQLQQFFSAGPCRCVGILHTSDQKILTPGDHAQLCALKLPDTLTMQSIATKQEQSLFILNCLSAMIEQAMFGTHQFSVASTESH